MEILSCSVGCSSGGQTLAGRCWLQSGCGSPSAAPARCIPRLWSVLHGLGHRNPVAPLQDPELHLPPPSSLNWGLRPFTEVFCLYPVPVLTQAPEEEAVCSQHERFLPKEPCFPQMVQDCASLSLETQEQMGCSSWALNCVSARTWSSFAKPSYWCVGLSCSYLGSIRDQ